MITQDYLQSIFHYNKDTGIFTRKVTRNPRFKAGSVAGKLDKDGYVLICIDGKNYRAHRLAWLYVYGYMPNNMIDHINGKADDNRIANLRECDVYENQYNAKLSARNTSGIKGVCFHKLTKKWQAMINVNGKQKYFGVFESKELSELIVNEARRKYHGEFFNTGKGESNELR